ncbi:MAG: hypothetical protein ACKO83_14815 [Roseiflexaceae bacterium]
MSRFPTPLRPAARVASMAIGAGIGVLVTLVGVSVVDHFANQGALYGALMVDAQAATDVCIFMCRNGGQMTLNFGRIIGNIDVDLRELATALNSLAKIVYAGFTTTNGALGTARTIVGVGALFGGVVGLFLTTRR